MQKYVPLLKELSQLLSNFLVAEEQTEKLELAQQSANDLLIDVNQLIYHNNPPLYELTQIHNLIQNSNVREILLNSILFVNIN